MKLLNTTDTISVLDLTGESIASRTKHSSAKVNDEMAKIIKSIKAGKDYKVGYVFKGLTKALKTLFNMNITCCYTDDPLNAWCLTPRFRKPTVLIRNQTIPEDFKSGFVLDEHLDKDDGFIDTQKAKVGGAYSKVPVQIGINVVDFVRRGYYTPDECTAVLMHEVGHAFNAMTCASELTVANNIINLAIKESSDTVTKSRYRLVKTDAELEKIINDAKSPRKLIECVKYITAKKINSIHRLNHYDDGNSEAMANLFAARMGYGMDLITGTEKLMKVKRDFNQDKLELSDVRLMVGLDGTIGYSFSLNFGEARKSKEARIMAAMAVTDTKREGGKYRYDNKYIMLNRALQELATTISNPAIPVKYKPGLIEDYDRSLKIIQSLKRGNKQLAGNIHNLFFSKETAATATYKFQLHVESLIKNGLFVEGTHLSL